MQGKDLVSSRSGTISIHNCGGSLQPFKVSKADLLHDDIIVAEYFTILEVMNTADTKIVLQ